MAPPNSLSKPLLQNRRGVIRNATIEEIEAEKSLIEEDAHKYAQYLVAAIGLQDSTPLDTLPRNLISNCTKKRSNRLVSSWPLLDTFIWLQYGESIIRNVHGTTLWGFCSPTGFFEALTKSDALCKCASFLPRALFWDEPSIPLQKVTSLKSK